jgi:pimeloyl-ACP methyl ester carboxylesterase
VIFGSTPATRGAAGETLIAATAPLRSFDRPVLIVWAPEDRVTPRAHGRTLAELFPNGRLIEVPDSYTLIPEDQPALLAAHLRTFISRPAAVATKRTEER